MISGLFGLLDLFDLFDLFTIIATSGIGELIIVSWLNIPENIATYHIVVGKL